MLIGRDLPIRRMPSSNAAAIECRRRMNKTNFLRRASYLQANG